MRQKMLLHKTLENYTLDKLRKEGPLTYQNKGPQALPHSLAPWGALTLAH
jgi:hypothetical protein